ncbi:Uma2 family endonuclease [Vacuolonema iberomarrocanum]|uniref:Uma2 family endonuclease n=1 Tax=Vacuolonema iberomarrocanum TaxID=3454632 RepID=UPI001A1003B6|nr:Uma2 family endonuclease [filamentous cyanobacterium LEGE 07170]
MVATAPTYTISWEKLPDDFVLPDDPVDNINQPALAAALTESLQLAGHLPDMAFTSTNYGMCATVNGKFVVKAPDWAYVRQISVPRSEVERSYTPRLQGEVPTMVLEFLSESEGGEYSVKATYPPGKFFFYEQVLHVPNYGIFEPKSGTLELYRFDDAGRYTLQSVNEQRRFWIPEMQLFLGGWQGGRENRNGYWLRWWDAEDNLLLWGFEQAERDRQTIAQERQHAEQERQRAEQERQRAERLAAKLRAAGLDPEQID